MPAGSRFCELRMTKGKPRVSEPSESRPADHGESRSPKPDSRLSANPRQTRIPDPGLREPQAALSSSKGESRRPPRLMPIVDIDIAARAGWSPIDLARAYINGGATFLQIRAKTSSSSTFLDVAEAVVGIAHEHGVVVVINDRADIARLAGAD